MLVSRGDDTPFCFLATETEEEAAKIARIWETVLEEKQAVTYESKLSKPWRPPGSIDDTDVQDHTWVTSLMFPNCSH